MSESTVAPASAHVKVSSKAWAILAAMGLGAFIAQMFTNVVSPALPMMKTDLNLSLSATTWIMTSYSLAFGTALVAGGRMGDLVGEVKMIISGYVIFGVGVVMSAVAMSGGLLIAGRTIQGIGIGLSAPATLSIVVNSFPLLRRGFAVGIWGFAHGFGIFAGPLLAGWMVGVVSWKWIFWMAVPFTIIVIFVTLAATRGYKSVLAKGKYDWIGLIVGGAGITLFTYGLQNSSVGWGVPATWGTLLAGLVLLIVFGFVETRIQHPLVDFSLWKERLFSGGFFAESAVGFVYIPLFTFLGSIFFISVLGFSPLKAGWVMSIMTVICMVFEPPAGRVVDKIGPGIPITFSLVMQAVALFWFSRFTPSTTVQEMVIPLLLMGIGVGIALPACNTAGMSAVDSERAGMGSGLMQMTFNIPGALGTALVTSIVGTVAVSSVVSQASGTPYVDQAKQYTSMLNSGNDEGAKAIINDPSLPAGVGQKIQEAALAAQSHGISLGMMALAFVALAGAIFAWFVIGRRRTPDHIQVTEAAAV